MSAAPSPPRSTSGESPEKSIRDPSPSETAGAFAPATRRLAPVTRSEAKYPGSTLNGLRPSYPCVSRASPSRVTWPEQRTTMRISPFVALPAIVWLPLTSMASTPVAAV